MNKNLHQWAINWGIPFEAVEDLKRTLGTLSRDISTTAKMGSEAEVQNRIRLEMSKAGGVFWRNNVGAYEDDRGVWVRYGLCNDSKQMNQKVKSSDLIGIRPVVITPQHVGLTMGQLVAREVKAPNWKFTGTKRENAQLTFLNIVNSLGGDGAFANKEGTL